MSVVDVTDRLDEVGHRIVEWDFPGARDVVQRLLDEPDLSDEDRLTARRLLAEVLRELGELDAAYDLADAVVAQAARLRGESHPVTVHALAVLAAVRHDYDEWDEAERLYHRVLDSGVDEDGDEPVCRAVRLARVNLALLQRDRGNRALALVMLNAAYVVHRREYGSDDLDTIRIAAELAALHHVEGNTPAARRLFTLAHAAARARLGTRHPFTRAVEWELAAVEAPMPSAPVSAVPAPKKPPVATPKQLAATSKPPKLPNPAAATPKTPKPPTLTPAFVLMPYEVLPEHADDVSIHLATPPDPVRSQSVREDPVQEDQVPDEAARRASLRFVVPVKAVVVVVVLALVLAVLSIWRTHEPRREGPAPTVGATVGADRGGSVASTVPAVRDLRLRDDRTTLTVAWTGARAEVVVALSRAGAPAVVLARVPPGTSEYVIRGLEPGVAYCVVIGPVDDAVAMTPATSVCTAAR